MEANNIFLFSPCCISWLQTFDTHYFTNVLGPGTWTSLSVTGYYQPLSRMFVCDYMVSWLHMGKCIFIRLPWFVSTCKDKNSCLTVSRIVWSLVQDMEPQFLFLPSLFLAWRYYIAVTLCSPWLSNSPCLLDVCWKEVGLLNVLQQWTNYLLCVFSP